LPCSLEKASILSGVTFWRKSIYSSVWNWVISCRVAGFARYRKIVSRMYKASLLSMTEVVRGVEGLKLATYIDFHLLISAIIHDQAMRQSNTMGLHRMTSDISIIANIRIVEVSHPLLRAGTIRRRRVDGRERGRHYEMPRAVNSLKVCLCSEIGI
jgi:hypothetical protein